MNSTPRFLSAFRTAQHPPRAPRRTNVGLTIASAVGALALTVLFAIAPPAPPSEAAQLKAYIAAHPQSVGVSKKVEAAAPPRDGYAASPGVDTLVAGGTNYDWAKSVLLSGGWPMSTANVTVLVRWMRQENGTDSWWNRNNPLNNGLGSGGGAGTGSYPDLELAAQKVAENLHRNPSFGAVEAAFASSAPTQVTEQAIWASPWASSHYANGAHWHYTPVPMVKAPTDAW